MRFVRSTFLFAITAAACSNGTPNPNMMMTSQEIAEKEPNDGPNFAGMQQLGALEISKSIRVKGKLSSGGNDGMTYTGDKDAFAFTIPASGGKLSVKIDWTGSADVDTILYDKDLKLIGGDNQTTKPIDFSGSLPAGNYAIGIFSKDQAADWTLDLGLAMSDADAGNNNGGPTCGANLYSGWWGRDPCGGSCEQYEFHQDGTYAYESYNAVSGTIPGNGTFTIACPNISVMNSDGSSSSFTVQNGVLYEKGNYKYAHCSGKCF